MPIGLLKNVGFYNNTETSARMPKREGVALWDVWLSLRSAFIFGMKTISQVPEFSIHCFVKSARGPLPKKDDLVLFSLIHRRIIQIIFDTWSIVKRFEITVFVEFKSFFIIFNMINKKGYRQSQFAQECAQGCSKFWYWTSGKASISLAFTRFGVASETRPQIAVQSHSRWLACR